MVPLGGCFCCLSMVKPFPIQLTRRQNIEGMLKIGRQWGLETHSLPGLGVVEFQFRSVQCVASQNNLGIGFERWQTAYLPPAYIATPAWRPCLSST